MPIYQKPVTYMNFLVRTAGSPQTAALAIARAVHKQDPSQAVFDIATPVQRIAKALGPQEFAVELLSLFAAAALLLASIGLYGVLSFSAGKRTKEIGIRSALGAGRWQILSMIAGQGFRLTLAGLLLGCAAAVAVARVISSRFEYASLDWLTFGAAALLLACVSLAAPLIPAWQATTIDPIAALRNE